MRRGTLRVDLGVEFELKMVGGFLGFRGAAEGETGWLEVEVDLFDVGGGDGEVDEILLRIAGGRALRPEHWR